MRKYHIDNSPINGVGVFARQELRKGDLIGYINGVEARKPRRFKNGTVYGIELDNNRHLVPTACLGLWPINHSCHPNAGVVVKKKRALVYALRAIKPGCEITCDYRPSLHMGKKRCRCGSKRCGGRF